MYLSRVAALLVLLLSNAAIAEPNWGKILVDALGTTIKNSAEKQETGDSATNNPQANGGASASSAPTSYGKDFPAASDDELFAESTLDFRFNPAAGDEYVIDKVVSGTEVSRDEWRKLINGSAGGKFRPYYDAYHATKDTFKKESVLDEYINNFAIPRANIIKDKISRNEPFVLDGRKSLDNGRCDIEHYDYNKKAFPIRCTYMRNVGLIRYGSSQRPKHSIYINQKDYSDFINFKDQETDRAVENALSNPSKFKLAVDMYVVVPQSFKFVGPSTITTKNSPYRTTYKFVPESIPVEPVYYRFTIFEVGKGILVTQTLTTSKDADKITDNIKFHCPQCRQYLFNK